MVAMVDQTTVAPYPMKLRSISLPKVWGGRRLEHVLGRRLPGDGPIGEVWTAWDGLRIANGAVAGKKLATLIEHSSNLVANPGTVSGNADPFPLLVKFLEARENLSVQVHPDDSYARAHEGQPFGKCEAWYVLAADPGATVIQGVKRPITKHELLDAARDSRILDLLEEVPVRAGDVLINTPGTIHALSAGVVIYELQQSCDLTYRLYDWARGGSTPRALHLPQASDVADLSPLSRHRVEPIVADREGYRKSYLCACRYFAAELLEIDPETRVRRGASQFRIVTVIAGRCLINHPTLVSGGLLLRPGESALIPSQLGEYRLKTAWSSCKLVESYVPDLDVDVVGQILQLGGDSLRSDLRPYVRGPI
jgi:mannose-6-phosphate isomerase